MSASPAEPWTVGRVLRWASEDFAKRGLATPRLDAELLLVKTLGIDRVRLIMEATRPLAEDELGTYRELIRRRRLGEPIAYILGEREFYALPLRVDKRVLIPRPDTEVLVETALELTEKRSMFGRALDLCTGSGCVVIALAGARPTWRFTATDISEQALELASENVLRAGVARQVHLSQGDLFGAIAASERFELITANPPYIPTAEIDSLEIQVRDFEPRLALDGGADGLESVRRIVSQAPAFLVSGGVLALEVMYNQSDAVAELFGAAGFTSIARHRDYGGHERVVSGELGNGTQA